MITLISVTFTVGIILGRIMKKYLKILAITAGIQIISFCLFYLSDRLLTNSMLPVCIMLSGIIVSEALGIILPIKWCSTKKQKVLSIIFLPTNYTLLFLVLSVVFFVHGLLDILPQIPDNFG